MTQPEVMQALGIPSLALEGNTVGAGNNKVTRWEYRRGRRIFCIDFDFVGMDGAPVVFRTELLIRERTWPWWWPWQPAQGRA
jgi:hypothetical protein